MEAVILTGIQGSGKTTFCERFFGSHVRISLDLLKTRNRERALLEKCLKTGQRFVVDNTNPTAVERGVYTTAAKRAGFRVKAYFFEPSLPLALKRNAQRSGRAVVPTPAVIATLKRLQRPSLDEGFDELYIVSSENDEFVITDAATETANLIPSGRRIFLLSPANIGGERGRLLLRDGAQFELAKRLRQGHATLGEAFAFVSGLYFRGKLAYATAFASPPPGLPSAFVITGGRGLLPVETPVTTDQLREMGSIPIDLSDDRYTLPLEQHCRVLAEIAGTDCEFVLLGSLATPKYLKPIAGVFRHRLLFPDQFLGLGDFSRGGLMLRCAREGLQLSYSPVSTLSPLSPQ